MGVDVLRLEGIETVARQQHGHGGHEEHGRAGDRRRHMRRIDAPRLAVRFLAVRFEETLHELHEWLDVLGRRRPVLAPTVSHLSKEKPSSKVSLALVVVLAIFAVLLLAFVLLILA